MYRVFNVQHLTLSWSWFMSTGQLCSSGVNVVSDFFTAATDETAHICPWGPALTWPDGDFLPTEPLCGWAAQLHPRASISTTNRARCREMKPIHRDGILMGSSHDHSTHICVCALSALPSLCFYLQRVINIEAVTRDSPTHSKLLNRT